MKPFKIRPSEDGQFYYVVLSPNGKVMATSETYTRKGDCIRGAKALCDTISGAWQDAVRKNRSAKIDNITDDQTA